MSKITRREFLKYSTAGSLAGLGSLAAPGILTSARAAKPIRIGCPMPLTGRYSREALYCVEGYKLWAKHINEKGYSYGNEGLPHREPGLIGGRKVELTILDDTSDPTQGACDHQTNDLGVDAQLRNRHDAEDEDNQGRHQTPQGGSEVEPGFPRDTI